MADKKSPAARFKEHIKAAKARGIAFTLTFEQWWSLWEPHWDKRGRGAFQMCMCRRHDSGGYELGNVRIATNRENHQEAQMERKVRHSQYRHRPREYRTPVVGDPVAWVRNYSAFDKYDEEESA